MNKNCTFEAWLNGTIVLKYADLYYNPIDCKIPIIVDYSDFSKEDENKVRNHQKLLFDKGVSDLANKWQKQIEIQYLTSENKDVFTSNRIIIIEEILFGQNLGIEFTSFEPLQLTFYNSDLVQIRDYAARVINDGQEYRCENVQSVNSPYYDTTKIQTEQYARALWNHHQFLKNLPTYKPKQISKIWFKIGLLFANGTMDELKITHARNSRAIARSIGMPKAHPYIASSFANDSKSDKNIFANAKKLDAIINYCDENNIQIVQSFHYNIKDVRTLKKG